jgi:hypothetical protein
MVGKRPSSCRRITFDFENGRFDIDGTKKIVEVYNIFTGFCTPSYLLCNRVAGYCVPHTVSRSTQEKLRFRNKRSN